MGAEIIVRSALRLATAVALVTLSCVTAAPAAARPGPPDALSVAATAPALVKVETTWSAFVHDGGSALNDGMPYIFTTRCSGFVVSPDGFIMTASHCVDPRWEGVRDAALGLAVDERIANGLEGTEADRASLMSRARASWRVTGATMEAPPQEAVRAQLAEGLPDNTAMDVQVIDRGSLEDGDIALLKADVTNVVSIPVRAMDASLGTMVIAGGFPASTGEVTSGADATFVASEIASRKSRASTSVPVLQHTARIFDGMSGGPVLDFEGRVIGVSALGVTGDSQDLSSVSPASVIRPLLAQHGVEGEPGPAGRAYRDGLQLLFDEKYQKAEVKLREALESNSSITQASRLAELAAQQSAVESPDGPPWDLIGGTAAGVVALAGLGVLVSRRRRSGVDDEPAGASS